MCRDSIFIVNIMTNKNIKQSDDASSITLNNKYLILLYKHVLFLHVLHALNQETDCNVLHLESAWIDGWSLDELA